MKFSAIFILALSSMILDSGQANERNLKKSSKKSSKSGRNKTTVYLSPGQSIQDALDNASDNTVIYLSAGDYSEEANSEYGLRISRNGIKLIGAADDIGTTRINQIGEQKVGVYAAPEGCEYNDKECNSTLLDFSIEGIVVENFPQNGIQTRFVDGFKFLKCKSINNLRNGLYATLSTNGVIQGCDSTGSLDAGLWVAGSQHVQVLDNNLSHSVTGLEVTVSKDLYIANNNVFSNVVGIGLYHANMAGTRPNFPPYNNWVFENNRIFSNNKENSAPADSFQANLPSGIGILMVGVRGVTVRNNIVTGHKIGGFAMIGFCTTQQLIFQVDCTGTNAPRDGDPSANDNTIIGNIFDSNGEIGLPQLGLDGRDIFYLQSQGEFLKSNDNCFEKNISPFGSPASFDATDFTTENMSLPTGGCL